MDCSQVSFEDQIPHKQMYTSVVFLAYCKQLYQFVVYQTYHGLPHVKRRLISINYDRVDNDDYSQSRLQAKSFYWHRAMASTPFYEDLGVGGVDVDCGADLDSDTNINGVASFMQ